MAENTKIQWCDHSASPWYACAHATYTDADGNTQQHPGCLHCYAEKQSRRNQKTLGVWGPDGTRVMSASFHANCRRWNKQAEKDGVVRSVFPSICDPFEEWDGPILDSKGERFVVYVPNGGLLMTRPYDEEPGADCRWLTMDDLRRELFATLDACPHLRFLLLTKRPQNVRRMWDYSRKLKGHVSQNEGDGIDPLRKNVWIITSISDQPTADALIPPLLGCRDLVPVLGVSAEPLLGPIDLCNVAFNRNTRMDVLEGCGISARSQAQSIPNAYCPKIDWVIAGGESGPGARPCDLAWIRSLRDQCADAGVPYFMKQLGSKPILFADPLPAPQSVESIMRHGEYDPEPYVYRFRDKKGGDPDEWPADLRVRQFPKEPSC